MTCKLTLIPEPAWSWTVCALSHTYADMSGIPCALSHTYVDIHATFSGLQTEVPMHDEEDYLVEEDPPRLNKGKARATSADLRDSPPIRELPFPFDKWAAMRAAADPNGWFKAQSQTSASCSKGKGRATSEDLEDPAEVQTYATSIFPDDWVTVDAQTSSAASADPNPEDSPEMDEDCDSGDDAQDETPVQAPDTPQSVNMATVRPESNKQSEVGTLHPPANPPAGDAPLIRPQGAPSVPVGRVPQFAGRYVAQPYRYATPQQQQRSPHELVMRNSRHQTFYASRDRDLLQQRLQNQVQAQMQQQQPVRRPMSLYHRPLPNQPFHVPATFPTQQMQNMAQSHVAAQSSGPSPAGFGMQNYAPHMNANYASTLANLQRNMQARFGGHHGQGNAIPQQALFPHSALLPPHAQTPVGAQTSHPVNSGPTLHQQNMSGGAHVNFFGQQRTY
ncbi:hypothetical protein BC835DRAFT_853957 [Cytidiella melzeri]|nr:hypothetical protein BC835DRAFT_853957 [Cytidiella melzeri]